MTKKIITKSLLSVPLFLTACSMFKPGADLRDRGFYERMAPAQSAIPLPVEIAKDIETISEEGLIITADSNFVSESKERIQARINQRQSSCYDYESCRIENQRLRDNVGRSIGYSPAPYTRPGKLFKTPRGPLGRKISSRGNGPLNLRSTVKPGVGGKTIQYIVKLGDTLMKIAFEKHANYLRWKEIYQINKNKMTSPRKMKVGTELTIKNVKYVYIKRDGKPYLIKKNDTLKSISKQLYGTEDKWKDIWKNNPELIRNPKRIYAGFSLYYKPKSDQGAQPLRTPAKVDLKKDTKKSK